MAQLRITLIGPFQVTRDGQPVTGFKYNKVRALLAYLAAETGRPLLRDVLAGLLWPDLSNPGALANLRYTLSDLRHVIGDSQANPPFLAITHDAIQLNLGSAVWVDVKVFEELISEVENTSQRNQALKPLRLNKDAQSAIIKNLKTAISLHHGPFLEQFSCNSPTFEEWMLTRREQIHRQLLEGMQQLAEVFAAMGDYEQSIQHSRQLLELEPWDEAAHSLLMHSLARNGQRSAALAQYETCRRLLEQELGVEPSPETQAVYESIRSGKLGPLSGSVTLVEQTPSTALARLDAILYSQPENRNRPEQLFGRQELIEQVNQSLDMGKYVLLYGMPGSGKTALAATIADQRILEGKGAYIWLKPVEENDEAVFDALVRRFGTDQDRQEIALKTGDARVLALRNLLSRSGAKLWVVDDAWNGPTLFSILKVAPDGMAVLVTSRFTYNLPSRFEVGDLSPSEGLNLLAYHAGASSYSQDSQAQELCQNLGNHAYALEIAGAHLKTYKITPGELLEEIAGAPHDLSMPASYAEQGRESVKMLLDNSYNALKDKTARRVLLAFGAFYASSATLDLLAAFLKMEPATVRKGLNQLMELSMATRLEDTQYYEMHNLTFSYARMLYRDQVEEGPRPVIVIRDFVAEHRQDFDLLTLEMDNILGAARAAQTEDEDNFIEMITCLATGGYMDSRGHTLNFLKLLDEAIQVLRKRGAEQSEELHYLLGKRGNAYFDRGELQPALEVYQEAFKLAPNPNREVVLMGVIGKVLSKMGNYPEAKNYFDRGYAQAEFGDDPVGMLRILEQYSHAASFHQDFQTARDQALRGIEISRRIGDHLREGYFMINLGSAEYDQGVRNSLSNHLGAFAIAQELHDTALLAHTQYVLGVDYHAMEEAEQAKSHLSEALRLYGELGFKERENAIRTFMQKFGYIDV